jgi:hypothetical protein
MLPLSQLPECNRYWSLAITASRVSVITTGKSKSLQNMGPHERTVKIVPPGPTGVAKKALSSHPEDPCENLRRNEWTGMGLGSYVATAARFTE